METPGDVFATSHCSALELTLAWATLLHHQLHQVIYEGIRCVGPWKSAPLSFSNTTLIALINN